MWFSLLWPENPKEFPYRPCYSLLLTIFVQKYFYLILPSVPIWIMRMRFLLKSTAKMILFLIPDDWPDTQIYLSAFLKTHLKIAKAISRRKTSPIALDNWAVFSSITGAETLRNICKIQNKFIWKHSCPSPVRQETTEKQEKSPWSMENRFRKQKGPHKAPVG